MAVTPRVTLDQWRALVAVVDAGGYAQAAEELHKSQSAVTYAVQKLESQLGVKAFEIQGRKAVLTPTGRLLYRRAHALLEDAGGLERAAGSLSAGWEAEIRIGRGDSLSLVAAAPVPRSLRKRKCAHAHRGRRIGNRRRDRSVALRPRRSGDRAAPCRPAFSAIALMRLRIVPAAHPQHPLHRLGRPLTIRDLRAYRHLVVRDSAATRDPRAVSVEVDQRWTVSNLSTSIEAARMGYGFAWYPEEKIREELATGMLKPLPLREGSERFVELYLILPDRDAAGPGTLRLAEIIREQVASACTRHGETQRASKDAARASLR